MEPLLDVIGAAQVLAVSPWTVRAYIRQGKLQPLRFGRLVRLDAAEIQSFIDAAKANSSDTHKLDGNGETR
jgi:excisionase family DNA binding protein